VTLPPPGRSGAPPFPTPRVASRGGVAKSPRGAYLTRRNGGAAERPSNARSPSASALARSWSPAMTASASAVARLATVDASGGARAFTRSPRFSTEIADPASSSVPTSILRNPPPEPFFLHHQLGAEAQLTEAPRGDSRGFVMKAPVFAAFCARVWIAARSRCAILRTWTRALAGSRGRHRAL
jgi:hypothetical protein